VAASCTGATSCDEEERNFDQTLKHHKNQFEHYRKKWDWSNVTSRLPTVSWPTNIPDEKYFSSLNVDLHYCKRRTNDADSNETYCQDIQFRIASFMLLEHEGEVQKEALIMIRKLAETGHPDGICAYATCLNDGRGGLEINPKAAVSWWMNACEKYDHIQSSYELGVAFYTGEGVPEDEAIAVEYFRRAADCGHPGASYMLGDCLLDGIGVARDRGEALEWLITSAELGHRGARSRVLAVLEKEETKDYGIFTDSSRQSLLSAKRQTKVRKYTAPFEHGKKRDGLEGQYSDRPVTLERRYTIGGGARNPHVLGRRKSIVDESRFDQ
jgi:TPR repeat protein